MTQTAKKRPALFGLDHAETGALVSWAGADEPIVLKVCGPDGEVAVPLTPVRALALAVALTQRAVATIKVNQFGPGWPG